MSSPAHLVLAAGPGRRGPGHLRLQRQQRVEQHLGLGDLTADVGVEVLAEDLGVLEGRQHADVLLVLRLGAVPGDVVAGGGRQPAAATRTVVSEMIVNHEPMTSEVWAGYSTF